MRTGAGFSTEAVYIFHNMVRKLRIQHQPDYLAAIFESQGPTFRDEVFEAYKATRTERQIRCRSVVLACGACESARLLLNSKSAALCTTKVNSEQPIPFCAKY